MSGTRRKDAIPEGREQFRRRGDELVSRFEAEVDRGEWITRRYPKRLRDDSRELYEVPALHIQEGATSLLLDPVGFDMPGAEGAADLYLMPACDPMASLSFEGGHRTIHDAFPPGSEAHAMPLTAGAIDRAFGSIAEHAVPSA